MLRVVGVVGYKDSGKTTLTRALAHELVERGHRVAAVKHASHHLDLSGKDTALLSEVVDQVGFISPQGSGVLWGESKSLEEILAHLDGDLILVEGFKEGETFPKIACLRGRPDDRDLFDGLIVAAVGPPEYAEGQEVPLMDRDDVDQIADLVEQHAFKLPALDCAGCGYERCYDLAQAIVAGQESVESCVSLRPELEVRLDGRQMPMNAFVSEIVRGAIMGLLSPLKGFRKGKVEITIDG